jgi:hypothetical protein
LHLTVAQSATAAEHNAGAHREVLPVFGRNAWRPLAIPKYLAAREFIQLIYNSEH